MPTLSVDLNGEHLHDVEVRDRMTVSEPFEIELLNHGEAVHVHLHLDDALSRVARLDAGNHYVEAGRTLAVGVETASVDEPVSGRLKIVTGYGAETAYVEVTVAPDGEEKAPVEVDESLAKPQPRRGRTASDARGRSDPEPLSSRGPLLAGAAALLVLLAVVVGFLIDSPLVFLGAGVLVGAALVGAFFLLR